MPYLFCNIGWMHRYDGPDGDIRLQRGGADHAQAGGQEAWNFCNLDGMVYGYVRPAWHNIRIEKLGAAGKHAQAIDGVTVFWTAGPPEGGTVVIGWYENATVHRHPQAIARPGLPEQHASYYVSARFDRAVLLPLHERTGAHAVRIPRGTTGGIGHSNIWYAQGEDSVDYVASAFALLEGRHARPPDLDEHAWASEGGRRLVTHLRRERRPWIVERKKQQVLRATGALCCEACGFDFAAVYGSHGSAFCEVHHLQPLHLAADEVRTSLEDLAIVCSNCHRMLHYREPMLDIAALKDILATQRRKATAA